MGGIKFLTAHRFCNTDIAVKIAASAACRRARMVGMRASGVLTFLPAFCFAILIANLLTQTTPAHGEDAAGEVRGYREGLANFIVPGEEELLVLAGAGNDPSSDEVEALYRRHYTTQIETALNSWGGRQLQKMRGLFGENFSMDSSLHWTHSRGLRGEISAVIPLHSQKNQSWFLQPGAVIWEGAREQTRRDINIGLVHRQYLPKWRFLLGGGRKLGLGGGAFFDHSTGTGISRIGLGFDLQDETNYASAQFYIPLSSKWRASGGDYEERAVSGVDLRLRHQISKRLDIVAAFTAWRRYDEITGRDLGLSPGWSTGVDLELARGLSLVTHYALSRDEARKDLSVHLRFQYPAKSRAAGEQRFDLWRPFEREQRLLYAERKFLLRVEAATLEVAEDVGAARITLKLPEAVGEDVVGRVIPKSGNGFRGATAGEDFDAGMREFTIAAGETEAEVAIPVTDDNYIEPAELFYAQIALDSSPSRVLAGDASTIVITDNDEESTGGINIVSAALSATPADIAESAGAMVVNVSATLDRPAPRDARITLTFDMNGHAARADADGFAPAIINIGRGKTRGNGAVFMMTVKDNTDEDGDAYIDILADKTKTSGVAEVSAAQVTIKDDDPLRGAITVSGAFRERALNDGMIDGELIMRLSGDARFNDALNPTYQNLPPGLIPELTRNSSTRATLKFGGSATLHTSANSINNFGVIFGDADFANTRAINVTGGVSNIAIDFIDAAQLQTAGAVSVREGQTARITLALSQAAPQIVSGNYTLTEGSAKAGVDFIDAANANSTHEFNIAAGRTATTISVKTIDNDIDDVDDRSFTLKLARSDDNLAVFGGGNVVTVVITDDDPTPSLNVGRSAFEKNEGETAAIAINLNRASSRDINGAWEIKNTGATSADYTAPSTKTFRIAAGQTSGAINIPLNTDAIHEVPEKFTVTLSGVDANKATLKNNTSEVTIIDTSGPPKLTAKDARADEGTDAMVVIELAGSSDREIRGNYIISDGVGSGRAVGATRAVDYIIPDNLSFRIAPLATTTTLSLELMLDEIHEADEIFRVRVDGTSDNLVALVKPEATVTIVNVGDTRIQFAQSAASVREGETANIRINLTRVSSEVIRGNYTLTAGSATAADYVDGGGDFNFDATETTAVIQIATQQDQVYEGDETFTVTISPDSGGAKPGAKNEIVITITDDDKAPLVITPQAAQKVYGETDPQFFYSANFVGTDTAASVFSASPVERAEGKTVGGYAFRLKNPLPFTPEVADKYDATLGGANQFTITKRPLPLVINSTKIYDGTTEVPDGVRNPTTGDIGTGSGVIRDDIDSVEITGGEFADANAGTGKAITGFVLTGDAAENYELKIEGTATIAPKPITYESTAANKIYDGDTAAPGNLNGGFADGDLISDDDVDAQGGNYERATAGENVVITGFTLTGAAAGNYELASASDVRGDITKKIVKYTSTAANKVYDATTAAPDNLNGNFENGDILPADENNVGAQGGVYANENFATNITVTGFTLTGAAAGNYELNDASDVRGDITKRPLRITANFNADTVPANLADRDLLTITAGDVAGGHTAEEILQGAIAIGARVGESAPITIGTLALKASAPANNYVLEFTDGTFTFGALQTLAITPQAAQKIYGENDPAEITYTANFTDADTAQSVFSETPFARAAGEDAGAYAYALKNPPPFNANFADKYNPVISGDNNFSITPRALDFNSTDADKVYDGDAAAPDNLNGNFTAGGIVAATINGIAIDDTARVAVGGGVYPNKNAGLDLEISGVTLSGDAAGNYSLNANVRGDITPKPATYTAAAANKVYDATTAAPADLNGSFAAGDVVAGDDVDARGGEYASADAGARVITGFAIGGGDSGNYQLTDASDVRGEITTRPLRITVNLNGASLPANLADRSLLNITDGDLVGGHTADEVLQGSIAIGARVGGSAPVTIGTLSLKPSAPGNNYVLEFTDGAFTFDGLQTLAITPQVANKVYGANDPVVTYSANFIDGDTAQNVFSEIPFARIAGETAGVYTYTLKNPPPFNANFADKYRATIDGANAFTINKKPITFTATAADKVYDGTDVVTTDLTGSFADVVTAVVNGVNINDTDRLQITGGKYDDKNAGENINISSVVLAGAAMDNYLLTTANISGDITRKEVALNAIALQKIFDGNTAIAGATLTGTVNTEVAGENLTLQVKAGSDGVYAAANAGENIGVNNMDGDDFELTGDANSLPANYSLPANVNVSGEITPKQVSVAAVTFEKVYDATAAINTARIAGGEISGAIDGQMFALNLNADSDGEYAFADAAAGIAINNIDSADFTLQGLTAASIASNYVLPAAISASGNITRRALRVRASGAALTADPAAIVLTAEPKTLDEGLIAPHQLSDVLTGAAGIDESARSGSVAPIVIGTLATAAQPPGANYLLDFIGGDFMFHGLRAVSLGNARVNENAGGNLTVAIAAGDIAVTPQFAFEVSSATAIRHASPADLGLSAFAALSTLGEVAAAETSFTLPLPVVDDALVEGDEALTLRIEGAGILAASINITIADNENATIAFGNDAQQNYRASVAESQANLTLPLRISHLPEAPASFDLIVGGDAIENVDYSVAPKSFVFAPGGALTANAEITVINDGAFEEDEHILFSLSPSGVAPADTGNLYARANTADVTIANSGSAGLQLSATPATEGEVARITITRPGGAAEIRGTLTPTPNTAGAADYADGARTFIIAANTNSTQVEIALTEDFVIEGDEMFIAKAAVTHSANSQVNDAEINVIIADNDAGELALAIDPAQVAEDTGDSAFNLQVTLQNSGGENLTHIRELVLEIAPTFSANATADDMTDAQIKTLRITAGESGDAVSFAINDDAIDEVDETLEFVLSLSQAESGVRVGDASRVTAVILDNDIPQLTLNASPQTAAESETYLLRAELNIAAVTDIRGKFIIGGDADTAAAADYTNAGENTFTIPVGATFAELLIGAIDDDVDEADEQFIVTLQLAAAETGATLGVDTQTLTITDNDGPPVISLALSDISITEGETAEARLQLTNGSDADISVDYVLADDSAKVGEDYTGNGGTIIIPAGDRDAVINITTIDDAINELTESFTLTISLAANTADATIDDQKKSATITIVDNDIPQVGFQTASVAQSVTEGDSGISVLELGVNISPPPVVDRMVTLGRDAADTALPGADYVAPTALMIPAGATFAAVKVEIAGEVLPEDDEMFHVILQPGDGYEIESARGDAVITILKNDHTLNFSATQFLAGETNDTLILQIELSHALDTAFTGTLSFSAEELAQTPQTTFTTPGAVRDADYTAAAEYTIAAGALGADITITTIADNAYEYEEQFRVMLEPVAGHDINIGNAGEAVVTLQDNDEPRIALVAGDGGAAVQVDEGDAAQLHVRIFPEGVDLSQRSVDFQGIRVTTGSDADSSTPDARPSDAAQWDYQKVPTDIYDKTLPVDERMRFSVPAFDDAFHEQSEVFVVTLNSDSLFSVNPNVPVGAPGVPGAARLFAEPGKNSVTITIINTDAPPLADLSVTPAAMLDERPQTVTITATLPITNTTPGYNTLPAQVPVTAVFTPPNVAATFESFVIEIPATKSSAETTLSINPTFEVGGTIVFAIGDGPVNATKGAGATLQINKGLAQLQMGGIVAEDKNAPNFPSQDPNTPLIEGDKFFAPLSFTRDLEEAVDVRITVLDSGGNPFGNVNTVFAAAENSMLVKDVALDAVGNNDFINDDITYTVQATPFGSFMHIVEPTSAEQKVTFGDEDTGRAEVWFDITPKKFTHEIAEGGTALIGLALYPGTDPITAGFFDIVSTNPANNKHWEFLNGGGHTAALKSQDRLQLYGQTGIDLITAIDNDVVGDGDRIIEFGVSAERPLFVESGGSSATRFDQRYTEVTPGTLTIKDNDVAMLSFGAASVKATAIEAYQGQILTTAASLDNPILLPDGESELRFTATPLNTNLTKFYTEIILVFTDADGDGVLRGNELKSQTEPWMITVDQTNPLLSSNSSNPFQVGQNVGNVLPIFGDGFKLREDHPLQELITPNNPWVHVIEPPPAFVGFGETTGLNTPAYTHAPASEGTAITVPVTAQAFATLPVSVTIRANHALAPLPAGDDDDFQFTNSGNQTITVILKPTASLKDTFYINLSFRDDDFREGDENILLEIVDLKTESGLNTHPHFGIAPNAASTVITIIDNEPSGATLQLVSGTQNPGESDKIATSNTVLNVLVEDPTIAAKLRLTLLAPPDEETLFVFDVSDRTTAATANEATLGDWRSFYAPDNSSRAATEQLVVFAEAGETTAHGYIIPADDVFFENTEVAKFGGAAGGDRFGLQHANKNSFENPFDVTVENFTINIADNETGAFGFEQRIQTPVRETDGALTFMLSARGATESDSVFNIALDASTCGGVTLLDNSATFGGAASATSAPIRFTITDDAVYESPQRCAITTTPPPNSPYTPATQTEYLYIADDDSSFAFAAAQCNSIESNGEICALPNVPAAGATSPQRISALKVQHLDAGGNEIVALDDIHIPYIVQRADTSQIVAGNVTVNPSTLQIKAGQSSVDIPVPAAWLAAEFTGYNYFANIQTGGHINSFGARFPIGGKPFEADFVVIDPPPAVRMDALNNTFGDEHLGAQDFEITLALAHAFEYDAEVTVAIRQNKSTFYEPASTCAATAKGISEYRAAINADVALAADSTPALTRAQVPIVAGQTLKTFTLTLTPFNDDCDNDGSGIITLAIESGINAAPNDTAQNIYVIDDDRRALRALFLAPPDSNVTHTRSAETSFGSDVLVVPELEGEEFTPLPIDVTLSRAPTEREGTVRANFELVAYAGPFFSLLSSDAAEFAPVVKPKLHRIVAQAHNLRIRAGEEFLQIALVRATPRQENGSRNFQDNDPAHYNHAVLQLNKPVGDVHWVCETSSLPKGTLGPIAVTPDLCNSRDALAVQFRGLSPRNNYLVPLNFSGDAEFGVDYTVEPGGQVCEYDGRYYVNVSGAEASTDDITTLLFSLDFPHNSDPMSKHLIARLGYPGEENDGIIVYGLDSGETGFRGCRETRPENASRLEIGLPHTVDLRIYRAEPILLSLSGPEKMREGEAFSISINGGASPNDIQIPLLFSGGAADVADKTFAVTLPAGATRMDHTFPADFFNDYDVEGDETLTIAFGELNTAESGYAAALNKESINIIVTDDDIAALSIIGPSEADAGQDTNILATLTPQFDPVTGYGGVNIGGADALVFSHYFAEIDEYVRARFTDKNGDGLLVGADELVVSMRWTVLGGISDFSFDLENPPAGLLARHFTGLPQTFTTQGFDAITTVAGNSVREGETLDLTLTRKHRSNAARLFPFAITETAGEATLDDLRDIPGAPGAPAFTFPAIATEAGTGITAAADGIVEGDEFFDIVFDETHADWPDEYDISGNRRQFTTRTGRFIITDADVVTPQMTASKPPDWNNAPGAVQVRAQLPAAGIEVGGGGEIRFTTAFPELAGVDLVFTDADGDGYLRGDELAAGVDTAALSAAEFFADPGGTPAADAERVIIYALDETALPANLSAAQFTQTMMSATVGYKLPVVSVAPASQVLEGVEGSRLQITLLFSEALPQLAGDDVHRVGIFVSDANRNLSSEIKAVNAAYQAIHLPFDAISHTFEIDLIEDDVVEGREKFDVEILQRDTLRGTSFAQSYQLFVAGLGADVTVTDNDVAALAVETNVLSGDSNASGVSTLMLDVTGFLTAPGGIELNDGDDHKFHFNSINFPGNTLVFEDLDESGLLTGDELRSNTTRFSTSLSPSSPTRRITFTVDESSLNDDLTPAQFASGVTKFTAHKISFAQPQITVQEGGGEVAIDLNLAETFSHDESLAVTADTATAADYTAASPLPVPLNAAPYRASISIVDDDVVEGDETFRVGFDGGIRRPYLRDADKSETEITIVDDDKATLTVLAIKDGAAVTRFLPGDEIGFFARLDAPSGGIAIPDGALTFTHALKSGGDIVLVFDEDPAPGDGFLSNGGNELSTSTTATMKAGQVFEKFTLAAGSNFRAEQFPTQAVNLTERHEFGIVIGGSSVGSVTRKEGENLFLWPTSSLPVQNKTRLPVRITGINGALHDFTAFFGNPGPTYSGPNSFGDTEIKGVDDDIVEGDKTYVATLDPEHEKWPGDAIADAANSTVTFTFQDADDFANLTVAASTRNPRDGDPVSFTASLDTPVEVGAGNSLVFRAVEGGVNIDLTFTDANGDGVLRGNELRIVTGGQWTADGPRVFEFYLADNPPANLRAKQFPNLPATAAIGADNSIHMQLSSTQVREGGVLRVNLALINRQQTAGIRIPFTIMQLTGHKLGEGPDGSSLARDYEVQSTSQAVTTLDIPIPVDGLVEGEETFRIALSDSLAFPATGGAIDFSIIDADSTHLRITPPETVVAGVEATFTAEIFWSGDELAMEDIVAAGLECCDNTDAMTNETETLFVGEGGKVSFADGTVGNFTFTDTSGRSVGGVTTEPDKVLSGNERKATLVWTPADADVGMHTFIFTSSLPQQVDAAMLTLEVLPPPHQQRQR